MSSRARASAVVAVALVGLGIGPFGVGPVDAQPAAPVHERWLGPPGAPREGAPLLIALHPWGSRGRAVARLVAGARFARPVRLLAPDGPMPYGSGRAWLGAAVADSDPAALRRDAARGAALVAALIRAERSEGTRVVVTGVSQGAVVTYALVAAHPELVDVAVPASGLLPEGAPVADGSARVLAVHGRADAFVPFAGTRAGLARLEAAGRDVDLRAIDHGHLVRGPLRAAYHRALRDAL